MSARNDWIPAALVKQLRPMIAEALNAELAKRTPSALADRVAPFILADVRPDLIPVLAAALLVLGDTLLAGHSPAHRATKPSTSPLRTPHRDAAGGSADDR